MSKKRYASVWDAIEDTPAEAEAAERMGVTQPRVSDLMRGKIDLFGLDTLVNMATAAGLKVQMRVLKTA